MAAEAALFYMFGAVAIVSALGMILNVRNTVASAMSLVVTMVALAAVYVLLHAFMVAALQIMVYAGAIVVLFLFVVMLLNLRTDEFPPGRQRLLKFFSALIGVVVLAQVLGVLGGEVPEAPAHREVIWKFFENDCKSLKSLLNRDDLPWR